MIDTIIDGGPISPSSQCKLLALLRSSDNVDGLVKLCSIEDLDPAVDALLATIPNPRVRSAWLMRPGRTQDEIVTMIRSEKRVTILAEIAALELPPGLHARLLEATDSVKVSLAIVESPHAPAELRVQAACKAAARDLNHGQRQRLLQAIETEPALAGPLLAYAPYDPLFTAALSRAISMPAGSWDRVLNRIEFIMGGAEARVGSGQRNSAAAQVREALTLCDHIVVAEWADLQTMDFLETVVERSRPLIATADQYYQGMVSRIADRIAEHIAERREGVTTGLTSDLMARIALVETDHDGWSTLNSVLEYPMERRTPMLRAIAARPGLSVTIQGAIVRHLPHGVRQSVVADAASYPPATQAALVLLAGLHTDDPEVIDLAIAGMKSCDVSLSSVLKHLVSACTLSEDQLISLPAGDLYSLLQWGAMAMPGTPEHEIRVRVGRYLASALDGLPETVWQQLQNMAPAFPASLESLVLTCKASCLT